MSYGDRDLDDALELFRLLRSASLRLLATISPEQWEHSGEHSERGKLTIADLARHMAAHDINRLQQVQSLLPPRQQAGAQMEREPHAGGSSEKVPPEPCLCLTLHETAEMLRRMPAVLRELILALPNHAVECHPGDGKWCIKQIV